MSARRRAFSRRTFRGGFSLIEVVIAVGIVAFVLSALVGLLTTSLQASQIAAEEVRAANMVSVLLGQRRAAPTATTGAASSFPLPALDVSGSGTLFLNEDGGIAASEADRYYRLQYEIDCNSPTQPAYLKSAQVYVSISSPWQADGTGKVSVRARHEILTNIELP